ncbi:LacI family DNA-binding transcriptional regulator [Thermocoleostomius sinensis]|uniref:LacI family DNA-binding transcriptional regulator n=1 Tax=Thermocoleostomius sinensis A174 TaxID=2016057 RepID=A0A9E8ZBC9_9CYAN|nr:LacI family DNA-binding transcriptional regulator [Thermocoleostomius sinensis]WAL59692.1 LacI family DNA-binding transcriptional regulator [Thermocoleostomius sinensis A174]
MKHRSAPKSVTLRDIAAALGISRTTVSNAFNRPDQLSPELRDRVMAMAKAMNYPGPNPMGRMLRTGETGTIGLVFSESLSYAFSDPVAIAFLQGVASVCERAQASLLIVPTFMPGVVQASVGEAAQATIRQAAVDGFILYSQPFNNESIDQVMERKLPIVAVDCPYLKGVSSVKIDDRQAAYEAAAHLIRFQHQYIAILCTELGTDQYEGPVDRQRMEQADYANALERLRGYHDALQEAGFDLNQIPIEERLNREDHGFLATLHLLQQHPRPTGILAMTDRLAVGAIRAAETLGLHVPSDVSIVGFDDIPLASQVNPRLTTIRQPAVEKGRLAAELLLHYTGKTICHVLPTELVVRESTGPAPIINSETE